MFDVTSEQSLLNVRNWVGLIIFCHNRRLLQVDSVRAGVDDSTVLCLVGNKVDLFGNDSARSSVYRAGKKLAEVSRFSNGSNRDDRNSGWPFSRPVHSRVMVLRRV